MAIATADDIRKLLDRINTADNRIADLEAALEQTKCALTDIRNHAATTNNGGAWASGVASQCLGTLRGSPEPLPREHNANTRL